MTPRRPGLSLAPTLAVILVLLGPGAGTEVVAQPGSPVYVDESPLAWELLRRARAQTAENEGEAVRLYQELLDEYGQKLVPRNEAATDEYVDVRRLVLADLRAHEGLLRRYRLMQTAEAQRLLDNGEQLRLARTRGMTGPGLDALLRAAQEALESARFRAAIAWLGEAIDHPDLTDARAAHVWFMHGLAAHYLDRPEHLANAQARLGALGAAGRAGRAELERLVAEGPGPALLRGVTPLDRSRTGDLTDLVAQTIWSLRLEQSLLNRRFSDLGSDRVLRTSGYERRRRQGDFATIAPTVAGSTVYVNEGHTIHGLDRFTGRPLWSRPYVDRSGLTLADRDNDQPGDLNVVAVEGDALVTLTGHAYTGNRSSDGRVVCLDASTGDLRWTKSLDRLGDDEEHEGMFPHGAPIIAEGRVFVLARQLTKQMLTGCYVVALDLETGDLQWIRHVASSGSKARTARPYATLVRDGNELFVSSAVGAIACLEASNGDVRWLRRYTIPINIRGRTRQPWEMATPVAIGDRIVTLTPDHRRVVVLDRETGDELEGHPAWSRDAWNAPAYLLAGERHVYAVGSEIRAFDIDRLDRPAWRLPAPAETSPDRGAFPEPAPTSATTLTITGRVQHVNDMLVVPAMDGVLMVDGETGRISHRLPVQAAGNFVAVDSQLVLAEADALQVYMSFSRAEEMLRERIAQVPDDPEAALSLLQLGVRVERLSLALEGAALALDAIIAAPAGPRRASVRRELFDMLLEIHRRRIAETVDEREALYTMIGTVAATADQRVEYLLARADGLAVTAPERAAHTYQEILSDPVLAATARQEAGIVRTAAYWAAGRLGGLIAVHGPEIYDPQADFARLALARLEQEQPENDRAFLDLALEFPYGDASVEAGLRAARIRMERGVPRPALMALTAAYHMGPGPERGGPLLGRFIEICLESDRAGTARAILRSLESAPDPLLLMTASGPRRPRAWLEEITRGETTPRLPRIGAQARTGAWFSGRVLLPPPDSTTPPPPDAALVIDGDTLRLLDADDLAPRWTATVDDPNAQLLRFDEQEVLLWMGEHFDDPRVIAYDTGTGRRRWTTPRLTEHLQPPLAQQRGVFGQMPDGLPFDPRVTLTRVGKSEVFLIQRSGGVAAFDRTGGAFRWAQERTLEQVHLAIAHPFGLVLAGMDRRIGAPATGGAAGDGSDLEPRIVVLDPYTGHTLHRIAPHIRSGVIWLETDPLGTLLFASAGGIEAVDLLGGSRRWTNISYGAMESRRGWTAQGHAIVESQTGTLFTIRLEDGALSDPFDTAISSNWEQDALSALSISGDRIVARYRERVIRYAIDGSVIGADMIGDQRDYRAVMLGEGRMVVLSQHDRGQVPIPGEVGRRTQRLYRLYVLSANGRLEAEPVALESMMKRIRVATLIDGWVLFSTNAETVAVPFGDEGE